MKALKTFVAIIISVVMIASTCLCMASFTAGNAVSQDSISKALEESGALSEIKSAIPVSYLYGINESYGKAAENALNSKAVDDYISSYLAAAIAAELAGNSIQGVSESELNRVISEALDEEVQNGTSGISSYQAALIKGSIKLATPTLAKNINSQISSFTKESVDPETQKALDGLKTLSSTGFKLLMGLISLLCCLLLVILFWKSRLGLLWAAIDMFIASAIYAFAMAAAATMSATADSVASKMVMLMLKNGSGKTAFVGAIIGVLMLIVCAIMRLTSRKARRAYRDRY